MKPKICHVIGDSHVSLFSGRDAIVPVWNEPHEDLLPQFKTYRLGAMLAYNLATERHEGREKLFACIKTLPKNSKVLLCFGEIDCRAHIVKQANLQARRIGDIAGEVAERYFLAIQEASKLAKVAVWGATPQSAAEHSSNKFPTVGSMTERNIATWHFNLRLAQLCDDVAIPFYQIFGHIVDENMQSDEEYFLDSAHMNQKALPFALEELAPFVYGK